jgi:hypothetical protein
MKRTAYVEYKNEKCIIIGTPYKRKEFKINTNDCLWVDLVELNKLSSPANTPFFAEVDDNNSDQNNKKFIAIYYKENKDKDFQLLGTVSLGHVERFTCVVPEKR